MICSSEPDDSSLKPGLHVPRDAGDLYVMHGQHHRARAARLCQRRAQRGELAHAVARTAQLARDRGREQFRLLQRLDRFARKAGLGIDISRVRRGDIDRDGLERGKVSTEFRGVAGHSRAIRCLYWGDFM
jgi:hypothetical protein